MAVQNTEEHLAKEDPLPVHVQVEVVIVQNSVHQISCSSFHDHVPIAAAKRMRTEEAYDMRVAPVPLEEFAAHVLAQHESCTS